MTAGAAGAGAAVERSYASESAFTIARSRAGWLLFFLFGLMSSAHVMKGYDELLGREIELSFFVPLLIGCGGNSGGQTVSTVIRAIGAKEIGVSTSDAVRVVAREALAGLLQSLVLVGVLAPSMYYAMAISLRVVYVIALTIPTLAVFANSTAAALPFLLTWLGQDPAVIAGPLMTTAVDNVGILTYLGIATAFLRL